MTINELCEKAHENAVEKGFYENPREIGTLLMLIVSELGEALEADRKNDHTNKADLSSFLFDDISVLNSVRFERDIKDTFEDELADAVIRIADLAGYMKIDLESHIIAKMRYNRTRERLHGKEY